MWQHRFRKTDLVTFMLKIRRAGQGDYTSVREFYYSLTGYRSVRWSVEVPDEQLLVIHALGVQPRFAGRGMAKQMAVHVIGMAREKGIRTVRLDVLGGNLPAERAYTAVGFRYLETLQMYYENTGWTDYKVFELLL